MSLTIASSATLTLSFIQPDVDNNAYVRLADTAAAAVAEVRDLVADFVASLSLLCQNKTVSVLPFKGLQSKGILTHGILRHD